MPDGRTEAESMQVVGFDTLPSFALQAPAPAAALSRQVAGPADTRRAARPSDTQTANLDPSPVRRVNPTLSREVLNELQDAAGKVTISVQVAIDATGAVETAKIVSANGEPKSGGTNIRLASLAAARQWRFRPAMAGGKAVPAQLTLVFNF
jgi:outer membrane biosynthesis protein TonB